nr:DUF368 domain-containing protein [Halovenus rubra]
MGAADAVPGVSGGTIALITGIYERLIGAVTALDPFILAEIPTLHRTENRREFYNSLVGMDIPFLLALGSGMLTAVIILSRLVQTALSAIPGPTFAFFFGLIGASALVLAERRWLTQIGPMIAGVVGFALAFLVAGETATEAFPHTLPIIFGAGLIAISGMILPGISGSFILLLLGQYDHMTETLNDFIDEVIGIVSGGVSDTLIDATAVVVVFMIGAFLGLFTIAFIVRAALARYRMATFAFLVSLMLGALRYPAIRMRDATDEFTMAAIGSLAVGLVAGTGIILLLDRYTDDLDYDGDAVK